MNDPIDFVITWVDDGDPEWLRKRAWYLDAGDVCGDNNDGHDDIMAYDDLREERYRDWGLLRYLFRGIDRYAPWVRNVFLVTDSQIPEWLNVSDDRLKLVRHEDIIPREYLPTFNSNAIEVNLHRIPGLSERFVYFNDDMFLLSPVCREDFFRDKLPVDMLALQPVVANPVNPVMSRILLNDSIVISRHFEKRRTMRLHLSSYFHPGYPAMYFIYNALEAVFPLYTGFYTVHGPSPLLKSAFEEVWGVEEETLAETSAHRFRSENDVTQYLFREWQKQKGDFIPRNLHRDFQYFELSSDMRALRETVIHGKKKLICVNDTSRGALDVEKVKGELHEMFETAFPEKCRFERQG